MHMKKQGKCNGNPYSRSPVLLVALNFFLGILLTYFFLTNVEWNSTVANIIFPIVVFIVARISCSYSKRKYEKNKRRLISIACIPSYFSSILYFVYYLFFLTVGFMPLMFLISEEQNKVKIQTVYSPDKSYYCDVYFTPTGAYASGSGKLFIYCVNTNFPLVRKHLYTEAPSYFPIGGREHSIRVMQWKNDRVISIGPQLEIDVSKTKVYIYYFIKYYLKKNSSP